MADEVDETEEVEEFDDQITRRRLLASAWLQLMIVRCPRLKCFLGQRHR